MGHDTPIPDLATVVEPLLGRSYEAYNCWDLLRDLYSTAWHIDFDADPAAAVAQVQELWFDGDPRDPLLLVQPWDVVIFRTRGMASAHVGVVFDARQFVHTRKRVGTCLEPLVRWRPRLMQLARLRHLC